jgi:hypothetical protein
MVGDSPYRLPKTIAADPRAEPLLSQLAAASHRLWPGSTLCIPEAELSAALLEALRAAQRTGRVVRSLEKAQTVLTAEAHGQRLADRRSGTVRGVRISRLLVLTNDGAERFYRQVASLLESHGPRVAAVRLKVTAKILGRALYGKGGAARLLLIEHKDAVGAVLLALADQWIDSIEIS